MSRIYKINGIDLITLQNVAKNTEETINMQTLYKRLTDRRYNPIVGVSLVDSDDWMSQIYFDDYGFTARDLYTVWLNATLNDADGDSAVRDFINNKPDEYDECDMIDVQAMYDDEEELNAVARYELANSDDFGSLVNNLESAAESINGAFGYVVQAVAPLINKIEDLCDPYLNLMYEMDYGWYDNYINMQADMFAAA